MNSAGLTALISGGSRGLGKAVVARLLKIGYRVATFSRSDSAFIEECRKADATQARFLWKALDAKSCDQVWEFAFDVYQHFGRIDALINNAAVVQASLLPLTQPEVVHSTLAVNVESAARLIQACSRIMLSQRSGSIINISSVAATTGLRGLAIYGASKAALEALTRSLARELGPLGIRVNAIAPGYLSSPMSEGLTIQQRRQIVDRTPLGRLGDVNDVVGVIEFLLSAQAEFITGQVITVDGGMTC